MYYTYVVNICVSLVLNTIQVFIDTGLTAIAIIFEHSV